MGTSTNNAQGVTNQRTVISPPRSAKCLMIQSMDNVQANAVGVRVCEPLLEQKKKKKCVKIEQKMCHPKQIKLYRRGKSAI